MTENTAAASDLPHKIISDAPAAVQDQSPRINEGGTLEKEESINDTAVQSPPKESGEEPGTTNCEDDNEEKRDTASCEDDGVKVAEVEDLDVPKAKESKVEADERIKLARRRRRCPVVDVDMYTSGGAGEMKEGGSGKERTLAQAIIQEDVAGLMQLLKGGASVSETDSHGWNPLHWASSRGSAIMTHIILQESKPSAESDSDDYTDEEATSNRFDCLNATEELSGWTPLHLAAIGGHLDVVYLLMEAGCDARVQDKVGDRAINCVKRVTKRQGGSAARLRNALLDLSDTESASDEGESSSMRGGDCKKQPAPRTRESNRERRCKR